MRKEKKKRRGHTQHAWRRIEKKRRTLGGREEKERKRNAKEQRRGEKHVCGDFSFLIWGFLYIKSFTDEQLNINIFNTSICISVYNI